MTVLFHQDIEISKALIVLTILCATYKFDY